MKKDKKKKNDNLPKKQEINKGYLWLGIVTIVIIAIVGIVMYSNGGYTAIKVKKYNQRVTKQYQNKLDKTSSFFGFPSSQAIYINLLEKYGFENIIISLKASNVKIMRKAYQIIADKIDYPLHLGVTEAGTYFQGSIKSAIGIGSLLIDGIGDTIRVSLTEDPTEEIGVAKEILKVLGIGEAGTEIISCPTCGRTEIDLIGLTKKVEKKFSDYGKQIKIAVMGCVVNGPGEAREADYGVAGGNGVGVLFKKGKVIKTVKEDEILEELQKLIEEDVEKK